MNFALVLFVVLTSFFQSAYAVEKLPKQLEGVKIEEKLGKKVDGNLAFTDHTGKQVRLADYFKGDKPVLLTMNYYRCKTLCSIQLNALNSGLKNLDWTPGENYRMVTVSIDPRDTVETAQGKRKAYLDDLNKGDVDWNFLVGSEENVKALADSIGFYYNYDAESDQYAHGAALFFLSPTATLSRYLYGIDYPARDIKFALIEAAESRIGSPLEKFVLSCYRYDSSHGAYGPFAFGMMRAGGALTMAVVGIWLTALWRREKRKGLAGDLHGV